MAKNALMYFDIKEKEEKTIMEGIGGYELSANGKKLLVGQGSRFGIIDVAPNQKLDKNPGHERNGNDDQSQGRMEADLQ